MGSDLLIKFYFQPMTHPTNIQNYLSASKKMKKQQASQIIRYE